MSDMEYLSEEHLNEVSSSDENASSNEDALGTKNKACGEKSNLDEIFVNLLASHGKVLLEKSQAPPVKAKKKDALADICVQLIVQHGLEMAPKQVMKKINNMKARIKQKTDLKQTGNKKIRLTVPEKKFFELMGGVENPSMGKRPYGVAIGHGKPSCKQREPEPTPDRTPNVEEEFAVEDNANTSASQINQKAINQRMLLEEQVKLIKAQQEYTARLQAQQDERHEKEMELLTLKRQLTLLQIQKIEDEA